MFIWFNFLFFTDTSGSGPKNYPCTPYKKGTNPDERRPVNKDTRKFLRKCFMIYFADAFYSENVDTSVVI